MSRQTLAPDWTGDGCNQKSDYWIWDYNNNPGNDNRTVLGGPSQTTECFPTPWTPTSAYIATQCPTLYSSACGGSNSKAVTCCPMVYDFDCAGPSDLSKAHGSWFPCISQYASSDVVTVTRTDFSASTTNVGRVTQLPNLHLYAIAMTSTSTTSGTTSPSPSSSPDSPTEPTSTDDSSKLSTGASIGIGIGVAAALFLLMLMVWYIYRRKKAAKTIPQRNVPPPAEFVESSRVVPLPVKQSPAELQGRPIHEVNELPN